jgi:hypothetical protein
MILHNTSALSGFLVMAHVQVQDGGNDLQVQRIAANILNKRSRTADMSYPPASGLVEGLTTHRRKQHDTKCYLISEDELDGACKHASRDKNAYTFFW